MVTSEKLELNSKSNVRKEIGNSFGQLNVQGILGVGAAQKWQANFNGASVCYRFP